MTGSRKGQIPKVVRKGRLESLQERTECMGAYGRGQNEEALWDEQDW